MTALLSEVQGEQPCVCRFQVCLTLLHSTLPPTGHRPRMQCSSADLAQFCLYQTTIKVCKDDLKEMIIHTNLKVGNNMVSTYLQFEGHPGCQCNQIGQGPCVL